MVYDIAEHAKVQFGAAGYVYVIHDGEFYKIGITTNITSRLRALRTANGREISLVMAYLCEGIRAHEKALHDFFQGKRCVGEWFKFDYVDLDSIDVYFTNSGIRPTVLNYRKY